MNMLFPRTAAGLLGSALVTVLACNPATQGLGEEVAGDDESGDPEPEIGAPADEGDDSNNDGMNDDGEDGDGGEAALCVDPRKRDIVLLELRGQQFDDEEQGLHDCSELIFEARVVVAKPPYYGLYECDCSEEPDCTGDGFELGVFVPDPEWEPTLEPGDCNVFHVFSQEIEPGVCERNRVDISTTKQAPPWYSVGSAREDLQRNGVALTPIEAERCTDECGDWVRRDAIATTADGEQLLGWGESAALGDYEIMLWRSYLTPDGCGEPALELTSWTAR